MKILVTSGGTKIPIDNVRHITNMSSGTFGSKIATEFLNLGHEVVFFKAKNSKSPVSITIDLIKNNYKIGEFSNWYNKVSKYLNLYKEIEYNTFNEYKTLLENVIKSELPDIILLCAAVSDYGIDRVYDGKIRTSESLNIKLTELPKVIRFIKQWHSTCKLVGFKLLVNSNESQLIDAAKNSIKNNGCDMVVANDLSDIKKSNHKIHLVFPDKETINYSLESNNSNYLANKVVHHSLEL